MIDILLKRTKGSLTFPFRRTILANGIALSCAALAPGTSLAGDSTGVVNDSSYIKMVEAHPKTGVSVSSILSYFNKTQWMDSTGNVPLPGYDNIEQKGLKPSDITVSGTVRFISIYRQMKKGYPDMTTSSRNISFSDYPLANAAAATTGGFPLLELLISSSRPSGFNFAAGYSFTHSFIGGAVRANGRTLNSMNNGIFFSGNYSGSFAKVSVNVGNILWTSMSKMTMGQPDYRDVYFERLPWDWYRNSFLRYQEYYTLSSNIGAWNVGRSPLQGMIMSTEFKPLGLTISSVYGRTNMSLSAGNSMDHFPNYTSGSRIEKTIWTRYVMGRAGVNYYTKRSQEKKEGRVRDDNEIISADFNLKIRKINFSSEFARGTLNNPELKNATGYGFTFKTELDKMVSPIPFSLEFYNIDKNVASLDGSVLNTNTSVHQGGYKGNFAEAFPYDATMMINVVQEVSQLANNRRGLNLVAEKNIRKVKAQLGVSMSQELENTYDTITIQHRAMAFTRSRFRPWNMQGGSYGRLKSVWRRTYETVTVYDSTFSDPNYKKGFNSLELLLKYKLRIAGRELVLLNFNNYNSVTPDFSPIPNFNDKAFVRTFYEDFTAAYQLGKKVSIVGNFAIERVIGNKFTQTNKDTGKNINQTGFVFGGGIDYDFTSTAGIHLRHTRFQHKDKNFVMDEFKGNETTLELKIFF